MESTFDLVITGAGNGRVDTEIKLTSIISAKKDLLCCELDGGAVMLDLGSGVYYGLDAVGTRIWELIQEPITLKEIVALALEDYAVDPVRCEQDVKHFLTWLSAS